MTRRIPLLSLAAAAMLAGCASPEPGTRPEATLSVLESLWIGRLGSPLPAPSNRHADDPAAARLGQRFFFDAGFSRNGQVSCATCHDPAKGFTDALPVAEGVGHTTRRAMPLLGAAWAPWQFWDGRKDSLWSQALGPLESQVEHGGTRTAYVRRVAEVYRADYEQTFGPLPEAAFFAQLPASAGPVDDPEARARWEAMPAQDRDRVSGVFVNIGKAIEAYERHLVPGAARFDRYVEALGRGDAARAEALMTPTERAGLSLFIGKGRCIDCHNGPLFTNHEFHNTGVPARPDGPADAGRADGVRLVLADEFNADSRWSDAAGQGSSALRFVRRDDHRDERAFKPPSLRNVAERAPYMHAGQYADLKAVIDHYDQAPAAPSGHSELSPLHLSGDEKAQLEAFLSTLSGPAATDPQWLAPPATR